jgi:hypothetical protein
MALFSVFRHTHEAPVYRIVKTAPTEFTLQAGRQRLRVSASLGEALDFFQTRLTLVAAERG